MKSTRYERQKLLNKMLNKEIERLRKVCFSYRRKPLLTDPIIIRERRCPNNDNWAGYYQYKDNTHFIYINASSIKKYCNFDYKWHYRVLGRKKKKEKEWLRQIILHELTHAYIKDRFEFISNIKGIERDASPIFLTCLNFFGGYSNHDCVKGFYHSDAYIETYDIDNYEDLEDYLFQLIIDYNHLSRELEVIYNNNNYISNIFEYSPRHSGLLAQTCLTTTAIIKDKKNNLQKSKINYNYWEIGCSITPMFLKKLVEKKAGNYDNFKYKLVNKQYYLDTKEIKKIAILKNF